MWITITTKLAEKFQWIYLLLQMFEGSKGVSKNDTPQRNRSPEAADRGKSCRHVSRGG
jgi:hypothetical protein